MGQGMWLILDYENSPHPTDSKEMESPDKREHSSINNPNKQGDIFCPKDHDPDDP